MASSPSLPVKKLILSPPPLEEVAAAILPSLQANFGHASVEVCQSPDLRQAPYHLAAEGLSGAPRIADVGGHLNLRPPNLDKRYDLLEMSKMMELPSDRGSIIGAGAGPFHVVGVNCEIAPNIAYRDGKVRNKTHYTKMTNEGPLCKALGGDGTAFALMANLYGSSGLPGPCLHVRASLRKGESNFTQAIVKGLNDQFGKRLISLGGVFVLRQGKAKFHVMPDFPEDKSILMNDETIYKWLTFHEMEGPITCLSVIHAGEALPELGVRMEHTHCFSADGEKRGGHYHHDLDETSGIVEYEGYFNAAEALYRIDQPVASNQDTHQSFR